MSERFELAYEKGNWWAVKDYDITLWKEEVIYLLNQLHKDNERLNKELVGKNEIIRMQEIRLCKIQNTINSIRKWGVKAPCFDEKRNYIDEWEDKKMDIKKFTIGNICKEVQRIQFDLEAHHDIEGAIERCKNLDELLCDIEDGKYELEI